MFLAAHIFVALILFARIAFALLMYTILFCTVHALVTTFLVHALVFDIVYRPCVLAIRCTHARSLCSSYCCSCDRAHSYSLCSYYRVHSVFLSRACTRLVTLFLDQNTIRCTHVFLIDEKISRCSWIFMKLGLYLPKIPPEENLFQI
jgi:hypothetical protein